MSQIYGELDSEKKAHEIEVARQMVKEIIKFGVTQHQILVIIQMLSLEVQKTESMKKIFDVVRDILKENNFLFIDEADSVESVLDNESEGLLK